MRYRQNFKRYLKDLAAKTSSPGGGSAAGLIFCLGVSLLQMALRYSASKKSFLQDYVCQLQILKKEVFPVIDQDAYLFNLAMKSSSEKRRKYAVQCQNMLNQFSRSCAQVLEISKKIKPDIKKNLMSDFETGQQCVKIALKNCTHNLKTNKTLWQLS